MKRLEAGVSIYYIPNFPGIEYPLRHQTMKEIGNTAAQKCEWIILLFLDALLTNFAEFFNCQVTDVIEYSRTSRLEVESHVEAELSVLEGQLNDRKMGITHVEGVLCFRAQRFVFIVS